jgi:serine/threonine-protein kinase
VKSSSPTTAIVGVGAAVVIAIIVGAIILSKSHDSGSQASSATTSPTYASAAATAPSYATPTYASPTFASAPADPDAAALAKLQQLAAGDREFVATNLAERWVPQLSSKRPGVFDDGITYNNASTLQEHMRLRNKYNGKLLWSGDWANFDATNFWVTVAPYTFNDSDSALAWCRAENLDADHCYAGVVSATHSGRTAHN